MTLYARGYRPYEGARDATRFAFLPIQREGARLAMQGRAFRVFFLLSAIALVGFTMALYIGEAISNQAREMIRQRPGLDIDQEGRAALLLEYFLVRLQSITSGLGQILVLFVGAGLIADDLKARALPLYLVRPVRPFDYWFGKFLVPARVLALTVLVPGLLLVLVGALFQPSDRMLPFLWGRRGLVGAILLHFGYVAIVWSSVALFVSTIGQARVAAIVLGAVIFFVGGITSGVAVHASGTLKRLLEAASLHDDSRAILGAFVDEAADMGRLPDTTIGLVAGFVFVVLGAFVVLRRARTVEVVA